MATITTNENLSVQFSISVEVGRVNRQWREASGQAHYNVTLPYAAYTALDISRLTPAMVLEALAAWKTSAEKEAAENAAAEAAESL